MIIFIPYLVCRYVSNALADITFLRTWLLLQIDKCFFLVKILIFNKLLLYKSPGPRKSACNALKSVNFNGGKDSFFSFYIFNRRLIVFFVKFLLANVHLLSWIFKSF